MQRAVPAHIPAGLGSGLPPGPGALVTADLRPKCAGAALHPLLLPATTQHRGDAQRWNTSSDFPGWGDAPRSPGSGSGRSGLLPSPTSAITAFCKAHVALVAETLSNFLVVSRLALAHCKKPVISVSPTLLGHTDKLFFENKEGKQNNKRKKPNHVNITDNNKGRYKSGKRSFGKKP